MGASERARVAGEHGTREAVDARQSLIGEAVDARQSLIREAVDARQSLRGVRMREIASCWLARCQPGH